MPLKNSSLFTIYNEVINPPQDLINQFDEDTKKVVRKCISSEGDERESQLNSYFWAKLNDQNDRNPKNMFTVIYSKKSIATGKSYGNKVAAPNPPFTDDQNPGTKPCDDGR